MSKMNEPGIAYLTNGFNLHPSWGTWERFLASCELIDDLGGCKWYRRTNCHYFVMADGRIVHHIYGYQGGIIWNRACEFNQFINWYLTKFNLGDIILLSSSETEIMR